MSNIQYLIIHCTDTPHDMNVTRKDIERWHIKERGWSRVGYNDMIHLDGTLENLITYNQDDNVDRWEVANGARGYNSIARHLVYVGGLIHDTRTYMQEETMATYCKYTILRHPHIRIIGHNQISNKGCPSFDVPIWLKSIGVKDKNILF